MTFDTISIGESLLEIEINDLGDASFPSQYLTADVEGGSVTVNSIIPEPGGIALLVIGITGLLFIKSIGSRFRIQGSGFKKNNKEEN